ncbi:PBP1A family penicillin-binding protein [Janthinobacterium sp. 17J80-10]|uniref:penicillin-binding protein 1A n=1 Tax=Janthinobacterium sp. 17J80-10 TaxID=2497863 RepID=UPI0010059142|nr:PBP1A family penicillin-binding protein [Janthinobacterium sp. 17J80-10]QAU33855.1 PBP1A family penicillin-binding protein [Janthinobacterium sp. 17J80-10]
MNLTATSPSRLRTMLKLAAGLLIGLSLGAAIGGAYVIRQLWRELPAVDHLATYEPVLPLRIYDRDGNLLGEYGEERRDFVPLERIPLKVRQALLAIEDARYYEHGPVDFIGLARSAVSNFKAGGHAQGASTITMQVARVFFLSRQKTYHRKIMEVLLAYKLESVYSKDKILELYMNQVYLGERAYGYAAAAAVYFDKTLDQLSAAEAAMLAGLPKAPSAYNPVANRERAIIRQQYILKRMRELDYLDEQAYRQALAEELVLRPQYRSVVRAAAYAVEQARQMVVAQYGEDAYSLGLDVTTTIGVREQLAATDALRRGLLEAQESRGYTGPEGRVQPVPASDRPAEIRAALRNYRDSGNLHAALVLEVADPAGIAAALRDGTIVRVSRKSLGRGVLAALEPGAPARKRIEPGAVIRIMHDGAKGWRLKDLPRMEGALVSMDAHSGEILALTGGFDFALNKFDHAVQAVRQPGSTFKPFVYSAALEKGYFPGTLVDDTQRVVTPQARGSKAWRPRNYGNNYEGFISARRGLARSKNLVAVNLMQAAGVEYVQQFATRFGFIAELNPPRLPLALGAGAVTPLQLTQAYAVFANGGALVQPRLITAVRERDGGVLYQAEQASPRDQAISARNAYVMDSMLRDVVQHGTGRRATALGREDIAGKTGTSNDARDVWFAGYSSGVASVVWMGYDQPRSLGKSTGGTLALPVWTEYMKVAIAGRPESERAMPPDLAQRADDYVYQEFLEKYLAGHCTSDGNAFTRSPFECAAVKGPASQSASGATAEEIIDFPNLEAQSDLGQAIGKS